MFCRKHYKNSGFSPPLQKKKQEKQKLLCYKLVQGCVKNWSRVVLKTGPSMLYNKIGPMFNTRNRSFLLKKKHSFLQGERDFRKQIKPKKAQIWDKYQGAEGKNIGWGGKERREDWRQQGETMRQEREKELEKKRERDDDDVRGVDWH